MPGRTAPSVPTPAPPATPAPVPTVTVLGTVNVPSPDVDYPVRPPKTAELIAAEQQLEDLVAERDGYEDLRTAAIEAADADELLRVEARHAVLPTLLVAAEVASLDAHLVWSRQHWMPLFERAQQYLEALSDLGAQRRRIDDEIGRLSYVLNNLDGMRESARVETRDLQKRRDELAANNPAARRGRTLTSLLGRR